MFGLKKSLVDELVRAHVTSGSWGQVSAILIKAERTGEWQSGAGSFTEWLESVGREIGVKEATLWRYLSAGRYYQDLRKTLRNRITAPVLGQLSAAVSPENIELLEKLERVIPKDLFADFSERVVTGNIKRRELREMWNVYRHVLEGRNARGRGKTRPRIDPRDPWQSELQAQAKVVTLLSAKPNWTGTSSPHFFHVVREIKIEQIDARFDVLALVRETRQSRLLFFGVEVISSVDVKIPEISWKLSRLSRLSRLYPYCDRVWLALAQKPENALLKRIPEFIGILYVENGEIIVKRAAGPSRLLGAKTGETAKELIGGA
jgi:hypothetical protein